MSFMPDERQSGNIFAQANPMQNYNTPLKRAQEAAFALWLRKSGRERDLEDYDLRGAWKANAKAAGNGHLPDTWKKPNHPTFSNESIYAGPQTPGGTWVESPDGKWIFVAPPGRDPGELQDYFRRREPGNRVVPPADLSNVFRVR